MVESTVYKIVLWTVVSNIVPNVLNSRIFQTVCVKLPRSSTSVWNDVALTIPQVDSPVSGKELDPGIVVFGKRRPVVYQVTL